MAYYEAPAADLATLFCLCVVRRRWPNGVPNLSEAARELGVCRELASRLYERFWQRLVTLVRGMGKPGPKPENPAAEAREKRLHLLEAFLGVARAIIAAADIAAFLPARRREIVVAVEKLHAEHAVPYGEIASALGLRERTLRRWRRRHGDGDSLAAKSRAPRRPHGKLPGNLAATILLTASLHRDVPLAELHRGFIRDHKPLCEEHGHPNLSYGAFRRNAGREPAKTGTPRAKPRRGRDAPVNIPRGALALMDTTDITCFGFPFQVIAFMEAHTREIFAHQLVENERAETIARIFDEGIERCGGTLGLRIDRGTPYLAEIVAESASDHGVDMRVARAHTPTDKAPLERWFKTVKETLHDVLHCLDLREGPGTLAWRRDLARTIAAHVLAAYLRWGYPYIPQPHIDGRTPRERNSDAPPASPDLLRAALDQNVRHHEHAKTLAREIHHAYAFRVPMTRWLRSVRGFPAEDLDEARRRFDHVLLKGCFHCDPRRNDRYFLAVLRDVAAQRKQRQARDKNANTWRNNFDQEERAFREEQKRREMFPDQAAQSAIELAAIAINNRGFGLHHAEHRLREALAILARKGREAYRLATNRLLEIPDDERIRRWIQHSIDALLPPPRSLVVDLRV